jgi:RNA polymerase sigma-70 factor (sigma-E family)
VVTHVPVTRIGSHMSAASEAGLTFADYVAARGTALLRFANLLTGDPHRAEDLVQDALARVYLRWSRISRTIEPDVYIRRILINTSRSWWRRRTNRELPVDQTGDRPGERPDAAGFPARGPGASGFETDTAERDAMWRLIAKLPHRQRVVIVLRYYEDLDDASIAEILHCSPVTVRTHAMRALKGLRHHYESPLTAQE